MRSKIKLVGISLMASLILYGCGPSVCDCYNSNDPDDMEECLDLMKGMSTTELIEEMQNCK